MIGECGLHFYKVGRIATIMSEMKSLTTPYYVIYKNIIEGNHTVLLLEYNQNKDFDNEVLLEGVEAIIKKDKEEKFLQNQVMP